MSHSDSSEATTLEGTLRVLIVTGNFRTAAGTDWLLDDLASEFAKNGHSVDVLVHSPTVPRERGLRRLNNSVNVFSVGTERLDRKSVV